MRKSIYILILILSLLASTCFAGGVTDKVKSVIARKNAAAPTCNTLQQSETGAEASFIPNNTAAKLWHATRFQAGSDFTICSVELGAYKVLSPTMNATVHIYDDNANAVGAISACADPTSNTISTSTFGADSDTYTIFPGLSCAVTNTSYYWIVVQYSAVSTTDYIKWGIADGTVEHVTADDDGTAPFTDNSTTKTAKYKINK